MPEELSISGRGNKAEHFFIVASVLGEKSDELAANHKPGTPFQVSFLVNGVELPFKATIDEIFSRMDSYLSERAAELLQQKLRLGELDDVYEAVHDFRSDLRCRINAALDVELKES